MSPIIVRSTANAVRAFHGDKCVGVGVLVKGTDSEFEPGWEVRLSMPTKASVEAFMRRLPELGVTL